MSFTLRQNGYFKNCSLKGSLGNTKYIEKTPFWNLYFNVDYISQILFKIIQQVTIEKEIYH